MVKVTRFIFQVTKTEKNKNRNDLRNHAIRTVIKTPAPPSPGELLLNCMKLPIFPENITNLKIICQISSALTFW